MWINGKSVRDVQEDDILWLIENEIEESTGLEYKQSLNIEKPDDKREFLADVSSFANKAGGVIIYGISTKKDENGINTGIPNEITGIEESNTDAIKLKVEQMIENGIQPRIIGKSVEVISVGDQKILMIEIPRSIYAPHCVWRDKNGKFFSRNSAGKYQMDVNELRQSFLQANEWVREANAFRMKRVEELYEYKFLPLTQNYLNIFIHILPLGHSSKIVDLKKIAAVDNVFQAGHFPMNKYRYNIDGLLKYSSGFSRCIQFFRNGNIEIYGAIPIEQRTINDKIHHFIKGNILEQYIFKQVERCQHIIDNLFMNPPFVHFYTLTGANEIHIVKPEGNSDYIDNDCFDYGPFDRNWLYFQGLFQDSGSQTMDSLAKEAVLMIWQAGGWD